MTSRRWWLVVTTVTLALAAIGCSADGDDGPGGSPPTLYRETIVVDYTPTTPP